MSELPGEPSAPLQAEVRAEEKFYHVQEEQNPRVWPTPIEGGTYWVRLNKTPVGVWLVGYQKRVTFFGRVLWIVVVLYACTGF